MAHIPWGSVVVELGCGDGSKTAKILRALLARDGAADMPRFVGLDCSSEALAQLQRNLRRLLPELPANGMDLVEAEYVAGLEWVRQRHPDATLCLLWLGSSVGNFSHGEAVELLTAVQRAVGGNMQLLLCTDLWKDPGVLRAAYHDGAGVTERFIKNGMRHALATLGHPTAQEAEALFDYEVVVSPEKMQVGLGDFTSTLLVRQERECAAQLLCF